MSLQNVLDSHGHVHINGGEILTLYWFDNNLEIALLGMKK